MDKNLPEEFKTPENRGSSRKLPTIKASSKKGKKQRKLNT